MGGIGLGKMNIYIEGGAKGNKALKIELRKSFQKLIEEYNINIDYFQVISGGSRSDIYKKFDTIFPDSIVLIDSEKEIPVDKRIPKWDFVCKSESWNKPKNANEDSLFFMAACMESWIVSDKDTLQKFYGKCFQAKLPQAQDLSTISKDSIMKAIKECNKKYDKKDSFRILEKVDVMKILERNFYAKDFFETLKNKK